MNLILNHNCSSIFFSNESNQIFNLKLIVQFSSTFHWMWIVFSIPRSCVYLSPSVINFSRLNPAARCVPAEWQWPGDPSAPLALRHRDACALPSEGGQERWLQWGLVKANGSTVRQPAAVWARCGGVQRTKATIAGPDSGPVAVEIALPATTPPSFLSLGG